MMGIWKAHPAEPIAVVWLLVEPLDGSVGDPVRVIPLSRHVVELHLRSARIATASRVHVEIAVDDRIEAGQRFGVLGLHPFGVVQRSHHPVRSELQIVKATVDATTTVEPGLLRSSGYRDSRARSPQSVQRDP